MLQVTKKPGAWICTNEKERQTRGRTKVYQNSKLYLNDGDEFEIELFNPTQKNIKADINIDGKSIGSGLILRSGERVYLECFPDSKKKFTFKTYEVDDSTESKEAISNNGFVSIKFYNEISRFFNTGSVGTGTTIYPPCPTYPPTIYPPSFPPRRDIFYCNNTENFNDTVYGSTLTTSNSDGIDINLRDFLSNDLKSIDINGTIETGQVDGGSQSDQEFESVNMDFEYLTDTKISYQLLPMSQKPLEVSGFKQNKVKHIKPSSDQLGKLGELFKLKELLESDLITREEFDILKSEII